MDQNTRLYCRVTALLFALVAVAHVLRLAYGLSIRVDETSVPMLASWVASVVPGALAIWGFRLAAG